MPSAKSSQDSPYSFSNAVSFINRNFGILFLLGVFFILGFFAGSVWTENQLLRSGGGANKAAAPAQPTNNGAVANGRVDQVPEITDDDHIRGSRDAKVILVEYSDFECPFCARFHPTMKQVREEYGDDVAWVYRHFPLSIHPNAQSAAEASECVADQGGDDAFWSFADATIEVTNTAGRLSPEAIETAAEATGINMDTFRNCLESGKFTDKVTEQNRGGAATGITGTPGTVVVTKDGGQEVISGALPFEQVKLVIDNYL